MKPYITVMHGMAGYVAARMDYYKDISGYDVTQTGLGRYKTFEEAEEEAKFWAECEDIDFVR